MVLGQLKRPGKFFIWLIEALRYLSFSKKVVIPSCEQLIMINVQRRRTATSLETDPANVNCFDTKHQIHNFLFLRGIFLSSKIFILAECVQLLADLHQFVHTKF